MSMLSTAYCGCYDVGGLKFETNHKKAYMLAYSVKTVFGEGGLDRDTVDDVLLKLDKKMTPAEIKEAKREATEWLKTHQVRNYTVEFGMYL